MSSSDATATHHDDGASTKEELHLSSTANSNCGISSAITISSQPPPSTQAGAGASVRYLEKRRNSTCRFADRVARVALDEYRKRVPPEQQPQATCIAAILALKNEKLYVLGLGVGTKFLTTETLQQENESDAYGRRVRDCHAEVLARRAFRRQLLWMIHQDVINTTKQPTGMNKNDLDVTDEAEIDDSDTGCFGNDLSHLIRRVAVVVKEPNQQVTNSSENDHHYYRYRYSFQPGVTLHMYTSTTPCGNATLKKFAKMERERFIEELGENEWPTTPHEFIPPHSWKLGQFSLLLKRDTRPILPVVGSSSSGSKINVPEAAAKAICHPLENACPPGTCSVGNDRGVVHTCSDKICRWNCLGLQGSLLSSILEEPLYLSSLTVGRKLTACICRRAVCCRVGKDGEAVNHGWPKQQQQQQQQQQLIFKYRLVHPAVMGTSVYVDEDGVIEVSSSKDKDKKEGQDVRFHSSLCWVWWPGKGECHDLHHNKDGQDAMAECINGTTGFCEDTTELGHDKSTFADEAKDRNVGNLNSNNSPVISQISTVTLLQLYQDIKSLLLRNSGDGSNVGRDSFLDEKQSPSSLTDLLSLKRRDSPLYETAKDDLLRQNPVLRSWKRRGVSGCHQKVVTNQHPHQPNLKIRH